MLLSPHFRLSEFTKSAAALRFGLDNTPTAAQVETAKVFCREIMEQVRRAVGDRVVVINSGIRQPKVNDAVGGHRSSRHLYKGGWSAADIECPGMSNRELANRILLAGVPFDTLILEFHDDHEPSSGWVHITYRSHAQRGRLLYTTRENGKVLTRTGLGGRHAKSD